MPAMSDANGSSATAATSASTRQWHRQRADGVQPGALCCERAAGLSKDRRRTQQGPLKDGGGREDGRRAREGRTESVEVPRGEAMLDLKSPPTPLAGDYLPRGTPLTNLSMLFSGQLRVLRADSSLVRSPVSRLERPVSL